MRAARLTAAAVDARTPRGDRNVLDASSSEGLNRRRHPEDKPSPETFYFIYSLFIMYLFNMGRAILLTLAVMSMLLCQVSS